MRIKRVEASTVGEAMRELRRELGDHALILHTKNLPSKGLTGWFKTPRVEILGAVDEPELLAGAGSPVAAPTPFQQIAQHAQAVVKQRGVIPTPTMPSATPEPGQPKRKGKKAQKGVAVPAPDPQRQAVAERLAKFRAANPAIPLTTEPEVAVVAVAEASTPAEDHSSSAAGAAAIEGIRFSSIDWARAGRRARRIALVGPTGAGKTTTLAKLAARAHLEHGRRVGLITIDTYRIGAVPQLGAYAGILGAPLEVASTPEELSHALARLNDCDLVFIDTIGRSPLGGGVDGLVPFLAIAGADEVHLVLSATTRPEDSLRAARSFARLVPNRLIITKVDETDDYGAVAIVSRATGLPLSWIGVGQEVPDDLEAATPERVAALLAAECAA